MTDLLERARAGDAKASQLLFESLFDHEPKIDNRTPAEVRAGLSIEEVKELRG